MFVLLGLSFFLFVTVCLFAKEVSTSQEPPLHQLSIELFHRLLMSGLVWTAQLTLMVRWAWGAPEGKRRVIEKDSRTFEVHRNLRWLSGLEYFLLQPTIIFSLYRTQSPNRSPLGPGLSFRCVSGAFTDAAADLRHELRARWSLAGDGSKLLRFSEGFPVFTIAGSGEI